MSTCCSCQLCIYAPSLPAQFVLLIGGNVWTLDGTALGITGDGAKIQVSYTNPVTSQLVTRFLPSDQVLFPVA